MNHSRSKYYALRALAMGSLLVVAAALAVTLSTDRALAKKPVCPGPHSSCDDGGDGQFIVTDVDNESQYVAGGPIVESVGGLPLWYRGQLPRKCTVSHLYPNDGTGSYDCEGGGLLTLNFSGWEQTARRGDERYCELLDTAINTTHPGFRTFNPTRWWYTNHQACDFSDGSCEIGISNWVFRGEMNGGGYTGDTHQYVGIEAQTGDAHFAGLDDIGLISIGARATTDSLVEGEGNVFAMNLALDVIRVSVEFRLAGKNKTAAMCEVSVLNGDFGLGDSKFTPLCDPDDTPEPPDGPGCP